jgi:hypothetical protein
MFIIYKDGVLKIGLSYKPKRLKNENGHIMFGEGLQGRILKENMSSRLGADTTSQTDEKI